MLMREHVASVKSSLVKSLETRARADAEPTPA
jgi:hypothetical protein